MPSRRASTRRVRFMMAKAEKTKLPKELGGFKLAKAIRKAEPVEELMSTPEGRALLSEAVLAGLKAAIGALRRPEPAALAGETDAEPRQSRAAAAAYMADGLDGAMKAWTDQFGPAPAEATPPARTPRRRAASPADVAPTPARRRARKALEAVPADSKLI